MTPSGLASADFSVGDLRLVALDILERALNFLKLADDSGVVTRREPPPLLRLRTDEEQAADVRALVIVVREDHPLMRTGLSRVNTLVQQILDVDPESMSAAMANLVKARTVVADLLKLKSQLPEIGATFNLQSIESSDHKPACLRLQSPSQLSTSIEAQLDKDYKQQRFVASVMQMCQDYRNRNLTAFAADDELALEMAYRLLDEGVRLPRNYHFIRTDDLRYPYHTYLSFADPGNGHLLVTTRQRDLLGGLIVHIEYIDRDNVASKDAVEAYRLPAIRDAARVRLHIGDATPCTAFIGRPVFEGGNFELGLLKAVHTTASVCSAVFAHGIADCKIAMDHMTAKQAVEFMRRVAGNVVRDPAKQWLSAAFNINTPFMDDLVSRGIPKEINAPFEIAKRAVQLVRLGRFNKIAWDGAKDGPGGPIIGQLSRSQLLEVLHSAHEHGLDSYISAGMEPEHMYDAACLGVGAVGIGTKLHYRTDGAIGEINPDEVRRALRFRDDAANSLLGKAARQLAWLDWKHADTSILPTESEVRQKLYSLLLEAMRVLDTAGSAKASLPQALESDLTSVVQAPKQFRTSPLRAFTAAEYDQDWSEDPVLTWAQRVIESRKTVTIIDNTELKPKGVRVAGVPEGDETRRVEGRRDLALGAEQIEAMFRAKDVNGLRRLYPL